MSNKVLMALTSLLLAASAVVAKPSREASTRKSSAKTEQTTKSSDKTSDAKSSDKKNDKDENSTLSAEIKKADARKGSSSSGNKALVVTFSGELKERSTAVILFGQQTKSLKEYLDLLRKAREDKSIKSVVFRFTASQIGSAMAQELRGAIADLRSKGKRTIAVLEDDSQVSYLVALACDEVVLPPSADLMLYGVKADAYFIRSLLAKVGVNVDIVHIGQYKSFGEMFTNDEFTSPARQNMQEIVDDMFGQMVSIISESRKITPAQAETAINQGPVSAESAKQVGLVDRVAYFDEVSKELERKGATIVDSSDYQKDSREKLEDISLFNIFSLMKSAQTGDSDVGSDLPQVAVVYAVGPIVLGSTQGVSFGGEDEIASDDFIETLNEIQEDSDVKAAILRINSPGGSAFASDLIWRKIEELKKVKPVVVSMSDVAASGGYYIAMGANKIFAQPGTMTGSIGVVGGKPDLSGTYKKLGVNKETISKGDFASLFSETSGFSARERQLIEKMMRETYDEFVGKAAVGRKMSAEKLDELAQGRVWTGERAKQVGLVDDLGGLSRAVQETKILIGLKKDDKVALVTYPKEMGLMDMLHKAIGGNVTAQVATPLDLTAVLPSPLRRVLRSAHSMVELFSRERVATVMPFIPVIE